MNIKKLKRFSIRFLLILTVPCAILAADLGRQRAYDRALERLPTVFPGGFVSTQEPTGLRRLQSQLAAMIGVQVSNRTIRTLEIYPREPSVVEAMTEQQARFLSELPPADNLFICNFEFSLSQVALQLSHTPDGILSLGGCRLRDSALRDLHLPHLTTLDLNSCQAVQGLDSIGQNFPELRSLHLDYCETIVSIPASLKGCRQLSSLSVAGPNVTDESLMGIDALIELKRLSVENAPVSDKPFVELNRLSQLQSVYFSDISVTDLTLAQLARLSQLQHLELCRSRLITNAGLAHMRGKSSLVVLRIVGIPGITDDSADTLGSLTNLKRLWLQGTQIGPRTSQRLAEMKQLETLHSSMQ